MKADDMILISVDDHIAEPADMFDAHVPTKYRHLAPRVETGERRVPAVVVWREEGSEPRSQRCRRQAAGDVQRQPEQLQRNASGLLRRARAGS